MSDAEKLNASQMPRIFYARHMQPGIVGYGDETILVDTDALKRLIASTSGQGIPVYLFHNEDSEESRLQKLKEQAVGYVTDSFYNEMDGWAWFKFLAVDDAAHKAIRDGWSISNAYVPSRWGQGGTKNNLPYAREVIDGEFTHLAIVPDPRYEDACIMSPEQFKAYQEKNARQIKELQNAKSEPSKGSPMFKRFFKNTEQEVAADAVDADTMIELQNGKKVSITEMVNAVTKAEAPAEPMVDVNGKKMPLKDLVAKFTELSNSKQEEEDCKMNDSDEEEDKEDGEDKSEKKDEKKNRKERRNAEDKEEKKNEDDDADEDEEEKEKKNSQSHFDELKNAHMASDQKVLKIETSMDQVARGKARYGSNKAA